MDPSNEYTAYYSLEKDQLYNISLEYVETRGNSQVQLYWQSDSTSKQIIPSTYLYNILYSDSTPFILKASPTTTNPEYCTISGAYSSAIVGVQKTITLLAKDKYSNLQSGNLDVFTVTLTSVDGLTTVSGTVTSVSDGTYTAAYTLALPKVYNMAISVKVGGSGSSVAIANSPFSVNCAVSDTDASQTIVKGTGATAAVAGTTAVFSVYTMDSKGNARSSGGDTIEVSITNSVTTLTYNDMQITDNADGTYTVKYLITDASKSYTLTVTVNGNTTHAITKTVTASGGTPSALNSRITKTTTNNIGVADSFNVLAKDAYGNVLSSNVNLSSRITGAYGNGYFTGTLADSSTGSYSTPFTISSSSTAVCGVYYIYSYFLQSGIKGTYYSNRWLTGDAALTRLDSTLSFNWGSGEIISGVASDYVGIKWTGYIKPSTSESYTFYATANDGVRVYLSGELIINNYNVLEKGKLVVDQSSAISLTSGNYYPITVQYFEQTNEASFILEWMTSTISREVIPSSAFFSNIVDTPITGSGYSFDVTGVPGKVSSFSQGASSTYALTSLYIQWTAPSNTGCLTISSYTLQRKILGTWTQLASVSTLYYQHTGLTAGTSQEYRVIPVNSVGSGTASDSLVLIPGVLPGAPSSISATKYTESSIYITFTAPSDTGYGDTTCSITSYSLEVYDGFSDDYTILANLTVLYYNHEGLILGHTYKYRVRAQNYLGYGTYSSILSAVPKRVPGKPSSVPVNVEASTTANVIYISYSTVRDNGGSSIIKYNIYIDDGLGGSYSSAISNNLLLTYNTGSLSLVSGRTYRIKFSAVNSEGEGELSDAVSILLAAKPGVPQNLQRIVNSSISAGSIVISWSAPSDTGGIAISGYNVYVNKVIYSKALSASISTKLVSDLTVGLSYMLSVSAINSVGESEWANLTAVAASVPSQMSKPTVDSSSSTQIVVSWTAPSFNGGSSILSYLIRRDDGPSTSFQTAISVSTTTYTFSSLSSSKLYYKIQVAAVNAIGQGDYSSLATYVCASSPSSPANFLISSQSVTEITLKWDAPSSNGGCSIEGYQIFMENIESPGFSLVYDGITNSHITSYSLLRPTIGAAETYNFKLRDKNCGYYSSNVSLSATAASKPSAPLNVKLSAIVSTTSSNVSWEVPESNGGMPITVYNIYKDSTLLESVTGSSTTLYTFTGLTLGTTYKVQISAKNPIGESSKSAAYSLLFANVPSAPTNLVLTSTKTTITASWGAPSSVNGDSVRGYKLYMDDGLGGAVTLVYNGSNFPNTLKKDYKLGSNSWTTLQH